MFACCFAGFCIFKVRSRKKKEKREQRVSQTAHDEEQDREKTADAPELHSPDIDRRPAVLETTRHQTEGKMTAHEMAIDKTKRPTTQQAFNEMPG